MKILLLADEADPTLWEHLNRKRLDGVGLILSAGDLPARYLSFLTCFTAAPILYIFGNHDTGYLKEEPEGCECIEGRVINVNGIRVGGLGGSMRYKPGMFQYTQEEMDRRTARFRRQIRKAGGLDILLTHAPAWKFGDDTDLCHVGFKSFLRLMDDYQPALMVHGHVHKSYGGGHFARERIYGVTRVINACGSVTVDWPPTEKKPDER